MDKVMDPIENEKLAALASNLVATLEVVVETTEEQLEARSKEVEKILKAAAEKVRRHQIIKNLLVREYYIYKLHHLQQYD